MKIAVWKTGHEIADMVADAVAEGSWRAGQSAGLYNTIDKDIHTPIIRHEDISLAYGILRGTAEIFKECARLDKPWFNIDRGYFSPSHYDGYYRLSLRGTQQTTGLDKLAPDYDRLRALGVEMKPWRGFDPSKPVLVCPPTEHVQQFFRLDPAVYWDMKWHGSAWKDTLCNGWVLRNKGDTKPLNLNDYSYVLTFNSSVGWQALAAGIPCVSDPEHSIVGAWFKDTKLIDDLSKAQETEREKLFGVMANLQLTLDEMRSGRIWQLVNLLMSTSVTIPEKPSLPKSPLIA